MNLNSDAALYAKKLIDKQQCNLSDGYFCNGQISLSSVDVSSCVIWSILGKIHQNSECKIKWLVWT